MKKPLRHKSKLQTILAIGRPMIILALALTMAVSVVAPAHAIAPLVVWAIVAGLIAIGTTAIVIWRAQVIAGIAVTTVKIILGLIQILIGVLRPILLSIVTAIIAFGLGVPNFLLEQSSINDIWRIALGIANAAFLLVLLIASIAIILRINTGIYNLKKFLSGFIQAIILANFSLIIVRAMVALGDQLTEVVLKMASPLGVNLPAVTSGSVTIPANSLGTVAAYFINMISMPIDINTNDWSIAGLIIPIIKLTIFIIIAWILIKFGLILIERMIRLFAAAVMAPLIFAGSLLPNFQKIATGWWENTIKWILVLPITIAFLIIALMFFAQAGIHSPAEMANIQDKLLPEYLKDTIEIYSNAKGAPTTLPQPDQAAVEQFAYALMGLFVLWSAGMVSNKLDIKSVMGGLVETPQKALALGQRAYKTAADTLTGKTFIGKRIGAAGRGIYNVALGTKPGQAFEARRQALAGPLARILNPAQEKARIEAERKLKINSAKLGVLSQDADQSQGTLDAAAQARHPGKNWSELTEAEQEELKTRNPLSTVRGALNKLTASQNTLGYTATQATKEIPVGQTDPFTKLSSTVNEYSLDPRGASASKRGDAIMAVENMRRRLHSADVSAEEKDQIRQWFIGNEPTITGLGLKYAKYRPTIKPPSANTSDAMLIHTQEQLQDSKNVLGKLTATSFRGVTTSLPTVTVDALVERGSSHQGAVVDSTELDTLNPADTKEILSKMNPTDIEDFVTAVRRNKPEEAKSILSGAGVSLGSDAERATVRAAERMNADSLRSRLQLLDTAHTEAATRHTPFGDELSHLIGIIKQAQAQRQTISSIEGYQQQQTTGSVANYQMTVNTTVPRSIMINNAAGTAPINTTTNITSAGDAAKMAREIYDHLKTGLDKWPTLGGKAQVDKDKLDISKADLIKAFQALGLGAELVHDINKPDKMKLGIDQAMEKLRIMGGMH